MTAIVTVLDKINQRDTMSRKEIDLKWKEEPAYVNTETRGGFHLRFPVASFSLEKHLDVTRTLGEYNSR